MPSERDPLLRDGLAELGNLLPARFEVGRSGLAKSAAPGEAWIVLRGPGGKAITCLVLARRRVEPRDLGAVAGLAARTNNPAFLVSTYLSPPVRERLQGFGLGYWDLAGNARLHLPGLGLGVQRSGGAPVSGRSDGRLRSLCGELAGRVARVLIDVAPPFTSAGLALEARVDASSVSRVLAYLAAAGMIKRRARRGVVGVDWQTLLRQWSLDAPFETRGEALRFHYARGLPDFLARLAKSGFLHALTGASAFAVRAAGPPPATSVLYVDEVEAAVAQFGLHPVADQGNVVLIKPGDRSVFHRSQEQAGLRCVSPSLMAADLGDPEQFELALRWLAKHEATWRRPQSAPQVAERGRRAQRGRA
jgi:hypothetical protein